MNAPAAAVRANPGRRKSKPVWRKAIPYLLGGALLLAIISGLRPKPAEVELATIKRGPLTVSVLEEGKTRIRHRFQISPPVSGLLNRISLRAGDPIEAGKTVLATIEAEPSRFLDPRSRVEAEARAQAAEAGQKRAEAQLERARAALELAVKDRTRAETLRKSGAVSQRDWELADNQVAVLTRDLRSAEFAQQVASFEAMQARAVLEQGSETGKSEPLHIVAPVSGFVLNVFEENARVVPAGTPLMEVGDPADLEAEIELLSSDAVGVSPGADVSIEHWGGSAPLRGKVSMVEPGGFTKVSALGVEEQRVKVRVDFVDAPTSREQGHPTLGDRFRVEARIITWTSPDVLHIPTGALFRRGNDWMTFAEDGRNARLTKVEIAHQNGTFAELTGGLREGERVILHPPDTIADGSRIVAREEP